MSEIDLRCENKKHAFLREDVIEVKCDSSFCKSPEESIVIHVFSTLDGSLLETKKFKNPRKG